MSNFDCCKECGSPAKCLRLKECQLAMTNDNEPAPQAGQEMITASSQEDHAAGPAVTGEDGLVERLRKRAEWNRKVWEGIDDDGEASLDHDAQLEDEAASRISDQQKMLEGEHDARVAAEALAKANQEDAERYEKIKELLLGADFEWGDEKETVLIFRWLAGFPISANLDSMLYAIAARGGKP